MIYCPRNIYSCKVRKCFGSGFRGLRAWFRGGASSGGLSKDFDTLTQSNFISIRRFYRILRLDCSAKEDLYFEK